jgi:hypothetical protein
MAFIWTGKFVCTATLRLRHVDEDYVEVVAYSTLLQFVVRQRDSPVDE